MTVDNAIILTESEHTGIIRQAESDTVIIRISKIRIDCIGTDLRVPAVAGLKL